MKKLSRFSILAALFVLSYIVLYSVIPSIVWLFGGGFTEVSQNPAYATIFTFIGVSALGFVFAECFDENFYSKTK